MHISFVSSVFFVIDVNNSRHFYENMLGQEVELDHGECVVYKTGFSIWSRDYAQNIIFKGIHGQRTSKEHDAELYFETDDIMAIHDKLFKNGVRLVHDIEEQPWGQRVFRAYDPDRHIVEFAEPMEIVIKRYLAQGMSTEDTAKRTSMPEDMVRKVAERSH